MKEKMKKRGRPTGSKNKKVFQCDGIAKHFADCFIGAYHINSAEALVVKILEKIRSNKKLLQDKYGTS